MTKFTVAILAKNEESSLKQLLPTLQFADEILVINDYSTDNTVKVAKQFEAKVINQSLNDDFSFSRQTALKHARNDWVLFIDADERLSESLIDWLKQWQPKNNVAGYRFKRQDWFWNQKLKFGEAGSCRLVRLVNKQLGQFKRPVHEIWETEKPIVEVNSKHLINHFPHPNITSFLEHINFYSTLNAKYLYQQKQKVSVWEIMFVPWLKFLYTYFAKLGFLDKAPGFIYSFMMSFHSFLTRAKLYQLAHHD